MSWGVATQNGVSVSLASIVSLSCGATEFSPASLFTSGVAGAWYDPSDVLLNWRTNLLTYSQEFDNAAWANTIAGTGVTPTVTADQGTAPDATLTADRIQFSLGGGTTSGDITRRRQSYSTPAVAHTFSVYLRSYDGVSTYNMHLVGPDGATNNIVVTGLWQRFEASAVGTGTSVAYAIGLRGGQTPANSNTADVLAWGAQLELGSTATTYQAITTPEQTYLTYDPQPVLYQDSAGTTPVTAVEQPVGLMLDKSQGLVLGSELVTNGDFSSGTGWTLKTGATISGGALNINAAGDIFEIAAQNIGIGSANKWYRIRATCSNYVSGVAFVALGSAGTGTRLQISANGTYEALFFYSAVANGIDIRAFGAGGVGTTQLSLDNISVKELPGNHASQATAASRPVLRARYNLLTYSEQFDNAGWTKVLSASVTANTDTAPDGTLTADTMVAGAANSAVRQTVTTQTSSYTFSCWVKRKTGTGNVEISASGGSWVTQTVTSSWQRFSVTQSLTAGSNFPGVRLATSGDEVYIWGAQLDSGSSAGTYQRIAAATDYATAGFLPYLAFDGVDDSMATGAFNISSTDKLNAVSGSSFFSSTANAMLYCTGSDPTSTAGTFALRVNLSTKVQSLLFGSSLSNFEPTIPAIPSTNVLSQLLDIGAAINLENGIRVNGASATYAGNSAGTGNFSATAPFYLGRLGGTSNPINAGLYQIVVCGKTLSASELSATEAYVATKTGVTL